MSPTKDKIIFLLIALAVTVLLLWLGRGYFFAHPQLEPSNTETALSKEEIIALQKAELDRLRAEIGPNETPLEKQIQALDEIQASSTVELESNEDQKAELDRLRDSTINN